MLEYDAIETPENVELRRSLAGIGSRFLAGLFDHLLMALLFLVVILVVSLVAMQARGKFDYLGSWVWAGVIVVLFVIYWGYFTFFEYRYNGQTPGKKRLRIRVVSEQGGSMDFNSIAIRNVLRVVDVLPIGYMVAGVCMFFTRRTQRLGDLAAGTIVLSEEVSNYAARADSRISVNAYKWQVSLEETVSPEALRATELQPREYQALRSYWMRRDELTLEARRRLLPKLLEPVLGRLEESGVARTFEEQEAWLAMLMEKASLAGKRQGPEESSEQQENIP